MPAGVGGRCIAFFYSRHASVAAVASSAGSAHSRAALLATLGRHRRTPAEKSGCRVFKTLSKVSIMSATQPLSRWAHKS